MTLDDLKERLRAIPGELRKANKAPRDYQFSTRAKSAQYLAADALLEYIDDADVTRLWSELSWRKV